MTRRRWGKAGTPLTAQEAANLARRKHQRAADEQATYQAWQAGHVTPWRITAALDLRGLYGPEVDEACGVAEPAVDMWEDGQLYPTWDQLQALAELTGFPARFFTLGGEPLRVEATSLLCGLTEKQLAAWQRDHREPVLEALPDAIAAATEGAPVEPPRTQPEPRQPEHSARQNDRHISPKSSPALVAAVTLDRTQAEIADAEWRMARDEAETVDCPDCAAPVGEHCRNALTGEELRAPAHPLRIRAATDPSSAATRRGEIGAERR